MLRFLVVTACAALAGCASTPEELAATSTRSLCMSYARAILNPHREKWLDEVYSRGESCAPYAGEMAVVSAQSQGTLNSLNQRYVYPMQAPPVMTPPPAPVAPIRPLATLKGSYTTTNTRHCLYIRAGTEEWHSMPISNQCPPSMQ